jgi:hypothetical protein
MLSMNLYPAGGDLALSPPITCTQKKKKVRQLACARGRGHGGGANRPMIRSPALLSTSLIKAPSLSVLYTEERMCLLIFYDRVLGSACMREYALCIREDELCLLVARQRQTVPMDMGACLLGVI